MWIYIKPPFQQRSISPQEHLDSSRSLAGSLIRCSLYTAPHLQVIFSIMNICGRQHEDANGKFLVWYVSCSEYVLSDQQGRRATFKGSLRGQRTITSDGCGSVTDSRAAWLGTGSLSDRKPR